MKKTMECGLDGKFGGKEAAGDNKAQASEGEHCPTSPTSTARDQVQASLSLSTPPKEGEHLHMPITSSSYCIRRYLQTLEKVVFIYM